VATKKATGKTTSEAVGSSTLLHSPFDVARSLNINNVVVPADELRDIRIVGKLRESTQALSAPVLNPCQGHALPERNIHNAEFAETMREFAGLDGGFVVDGKGIGRSAGTYFDAQVKKPRLRPGLGGPD
jgi:hypothetical protein